MTQSRLHPGHALLAVLMLAAVALGWRALNLALAPLPAPPPFAPPALADRDLLARTDPFFPAAVASDQSLPVTALPFSLHGLRADSATGRGSAIIAAGDGVQKVYTVGEPVADGVTLAAITADHVVLDRGGTREALWLDSGGEQPVQAFDPASGSLGASGGGGMPAPPPPFAGAPGAEPTNSVSAEPDALDLAPPPGMGGRRAPADPALRSEEGTGE